MRISTPSSTWLVLILNAISIATAKSSKLSSLCRGEKVALRSIGQLEALVAELDSVGEECTKRVREALEQVAKLAATSEEGVCTMEKARAITDFVDTYLKTRGHDDSSGDQTGGEQQLPRPLVKFVIAYGMKISGICSNKMVIQFGVMANRELKFNYVWVSHYELLTQYISDESPLGSLLEPLIRTGEVILPVDLMQALSGLASHSNLMVPKALGLTRLKVLCERALRPLYEPLLLPLAHLIRAGFNNRHSRYWQRRYKQNARFWSRAVFLCEIAKSIDFDPQQQVDDTGNEETKIALQMKQAMEGIYDVRGDLMPWEKKPDFYSMEPLPASQTPGTIYGRFDFSTRSLVKAFDANKNHVELLRERILKRSFRILRRLFRMKGFSEVLSRLLKADKSREAKLNGAKEELISLLGAQRGDSRAYKWLVKLPKSIKDAILFCTLVAVLLLPGLITLIFAPKPLKAKLYKGLHVVTHDWLHYH